WRRFTLSCLNGFFHFGGNFRTPFFERLGVGPVVFEDQLFSARYTILGPRFLLHLRWNVAGVVVFAVTGQTQERSDHQLRRSAGPRAFHRAADHFKGGG